MRAVLPDEGQRDAALKALKSADTVAISVHSLCEFSSVLERRFGADKLQIGTSIRMLVDTGNVVVNRPAVMPG